MWTSPAPANYLMEVSTIQKPLSRFPPTPRGLQMLSDHLLILGCAALFEMYLPCSCSPIPPTIAWPKPGKCHSHIPKRKKKNTSGQTTLQVTMVCSASCISRDNPSARLNGETSEFVCQTAGYFGYTSNCRFQSSQKASGVVVVYE